MVIFGFKFIIIPLVLKYIVISRPEFYQIWFSAFRVVFQRCWGVASPCNQEIRIITQSDPARIVSFHIINQNAMTGQNIPIYINVGEQVETPQSINKTILIARLIYSEQGSLLDEKYAMIKKKLTVQCQLLKLSTGRKAVLISANC